MREHRTKLSATAIIREEWQLHEIDDSISEADAAQVAAEEEVKAAFSYLGTGDAPPPIIKENG